MLTRQPTLDLADLERPALETALEARGHPRFHAGQIFRWIYGRGVVDPSAMTDLSRELRAMLAEACTISTPAIVQREKSIDGTEKFLLRLADGRLVESVFIPDTPSMTFCISTQVGCAMACAFCLTGKMGLVRNLSTAEIVGQVRVLADALHLRDARFNIVLMGMGEPLHNYDETMKALRILSDETVDRFAETLAEHGLTVSVRKSRGRDIRAACGQLIVEGQKRSAGQQLAVMM